MRRTTMMETAAITSSTPSQMGSLRRKRMEPVLTGERMIAEAYIGINLISCAVISQEWQLEMAER